MFSNNLNEINNRSEPNDELYTPAYLSLKFIKEMDISTEDNCLDPFYGTGSFFNNFTTASLIPI